MTNYFTTLFLFIILLTFSEAFAQDKVEREMRIKSREVPAAAKEWLDDAFEEKKKPKWYKEIFEEGYSYEAKFDYRGKYHSVEFDSLGNVQDVEIEMEMSELDQDVRRNIQSYLEENFSRFKVLKIQIQYSGEEGDLEDFFDEDETEGITIAYEMEFQGKSVEGKDELWEGLFDQLGHFLRRRIILVNTSDNLIF
ncbi:hypothetical protein [Algoriphagus namhaensis]